jgi:hypothetical protein
MGLGLLGESLLLNLRQQQLRFGQRQTQVGNISKPIRPADRHHLVTPRLTITPRPDQTQRQFHPRIPSRQHTRLVLSQSS